MIRKLFDRYYSRNMGALFSEDLRQMVWDIGVPKYMHAKLRKTLDESVFTHGCASPGTRRGMTINEFIVWFQNQLQGKQAPKKVPAKKVPVKKNILREGSRVRIRDNESGRNGARATIISRDRRDW